MFLWVIYNDMVNIILYLRNLGVSVVKGEYFVFFDVDVELVLEWFDVMFCIF